MAFAHAHGFEGRLSLSTFVTFKQRLDIESGRRRPFKVAAGRLPDDVHPIARMSYEGFLHLLGARWNHTPYEPAPWTHDFAVRWCGGTFTERQAKDARSYLVRLGAFVCVGQLTIETSKGTREGRAKLWLPWGVVK